MAASWTGEACFFHSTSFTEISARIALTQTGSITMGYNNVTGLPEILVAQPGGTFLTVDHTGKMEGHPLLSSSTPSSISSVGAQTEIICVNMGAPSLPLSS